MATVKQQFRTRKDGTRVAIRGVRLARVLNNRIDELVTEDRTRADIIQAMARAAGITPGAVNEILRARIDCPPNRRLRAFARVLDMSASTLIAAKRRDGCPDEAGRCLEMLEEIAEDLEAQ